MIKLGNLSTITKTIGKIAYDNLPTITTVMSISGLFLTVSSAIRATPKALANLDDFIYERCSENGEEFPYDLDIYGRVSELSAKDIFLTCYKQYIPTVILGSITVGCILCTNTIHLKRQAILASLYSISEKALDEYRLKTREIIGEKKEQAIRDEIAADKVKTIPVSAQSIVMSGDVLCFDAFSGRTFSSSMNQICKVRNDLNYALRTDMWVSINELYYALGMDGIGQGDEMGWNADNPIDLTFSTQLTEDDRPCLVMDYLVGPRFNYKGGY